MTDYHFTTRRPYESSGDSYLTYDARRSLRHHGSSSHQHSNRGGTYARPGQPQASPHRRTRSFSASAASRRAMTIHLAQQRSSQNKSQVLTKSSIDTSDGATPAKVTFAPSPQDPHRSESKISSSKIPGIGKLSISSFVKNTIMSITKSSPLLKRSNSFSGGSEVQSQKKSGDQGSLSPSNGKPATQVTKQSTKADIRTTSMPGVVGIINHGNSCFINAVVQCLSNIHPFLEFFLENSRHFERPLTKSFANLLESLWLRKYTAKVSQKFRKSVASSFNQFVDDSQNDSQEFLLLFLDGIQQELSTDENMKNKVGYDLSRNLIKRLFETKLTSCLTCSRCRQSSHTFDTQLTVCLPIQDPVTVSVIHIPTNVHERQSLHAFHANSGQTVRQLLEMAGHKLKVHPRNVALIRISKKGKYQEQKSLSSSLSSIMPFNYLFLVQLANRKSSNSATRSSSMTKTSPDRHDDDDYRRQNGIDRDDGRRLGGEFVNIVTLPTVRTDGGLKRFGSLVSLDVMRTCSYFELQMSILARLKPYFASSFFVTKNVRSNFRMRVHGTRARTNRTPSNESDEDDDDDDDDEDDDEDSYLRSTDEMPLFSLVVERALSLFDEGAFGTPHLRLVLEFQHNVREYLLRLNQENFFVKDMSYREIVEKPNDNINSSCDLVSCLEAFTQQEQLEADDIWTCSRCLSRRSGSLKTLTFTYLPEVLIILLKRFRQEGDYRLKIETHVEFPVDGLDLSRVVTSDSNSSSSLIPPHSLPWNDSKRLNKTWDNAFPERGLNSEASNDDDLIYDLVAVCNHHGDLTNGHYTAYCKNPLNQTWYHFNDNKVEELPVDRIVTNSAYMLFYWRRGHRSQSRKDLIDLINNRQPTNGISSTDSSNSLLSFIGLNGQPSCSLSLDNLSSNQIPSKANPPLLKSILKPSPSMPLSPAKSKSTNAHVRICDEASVDGRGTPQSKEPVHLYSKPPMSHLNGHHPRSARPDSKPDKLLPTAKPQKSLPATKPTQVVAKTSQVKSAQSDIKTMTLCPPRLEAKLPPSTKRKTEELLRRMREQAFQDSDLKKSATLVFEKVPPGFSRSPGKRTTPINSTTLQKGARSLSKLESTV